MRKLIAFFAIASALTVVFAGSVATSASAKASDCQRDCGGQVPLLMPFEVVGSGQYWPTYPGVNAYDATTCMEFDQGGHYIMTNTACTPTQSDQDRDSWHDNVDNCPTVWNAG